ncbi:MAG: hypothetical protein E6G56_00900 [Actinobacteria bacterium]|nr:MAG: hypothetical protein E6G56_00900 [Actinomycetota bacterium]
MRPARLFAAAALAAGAAAVVALDPFSSAAGPAPRGATVPAHWSTFSHLRLVVDLSAPRPDGRLVVAYDGRLGLLDPRGGLASFAAGPGGYRTPTGPEPYIALSPRRAGRCGYGRNAVYALEPKGPSVVRVTATGHAGVFARLPAGSFPNGIAFDTTGRFGRRLLVTAAKGSKTSVLAIDCRGRGRTVTSSAPRLEGGIAIAPAGFGAHGGELIAPDEHGGSVLAISPSGRASVLVASGLPAGGDTGVESAGFVPKTLGRLVDGYLADRSSPGSPTAGTDSVLVLRGPDLLRAGVRGGDLLVATEAGARTIDVRCARRRPCRVHEVADGPAAAHAEGHISFARRR